MKTQKVESRRYRTGKSTACRRFRAFFSPEILQAVAVKGLTSNTYTFALGETRPCVATLHPGGTTLSRGCGKGIGAGSCLKRLCAALLLEKIGKR